MGKDTSKWWSGQGAYLPRSMLHWRVWSLDCLDATCWVLRTKCWSLWPVQRCVLQPDYSGRPRTWHTVQQWATWNPGMEPAEPRSLFVAAFGKHWKLTKQQLRQASLLNKNRVPKERGQGVGEDTRDYNDKHQTCWANRKRRPPIRRPSEWAYLDQLAVSD